MKLEPLPAAALRYGRRGWAVFPLRNQEKKPQINDWPNEATTDKERIRRLWQRYPVANVGIVTGRRSGLLVVDVDNKKKKRGFESLARLEKELGTLITPLRVKTPHGIHLYFRFPEVEIRNSASSIAAGIDIRGEGGYVVAPPSVTKDGVYVWQ